MNYLRFAVLVILALASGCGSRAPTFVPVSGRVTMDNKPLANVNVHFQPLATDASLDPGPGSYGETDKDGRFRLKVSSQQFSGDGAVVAKHRVKISSKLEQVKIDPELGSPDGAPLTERETIPSIYHQDSVLEFDVPPGGTDKADFQLTMKPERKKK